VIDNGKNDGDHRVKGEKSEPIALPWALFAGTGPSLILEKTGQDNETARRCSCMWKRGYLIECAGASAFWKKNSGAGARTVLADHPKIPPLLASKFIDVFLVRFQTH
jgi:hypothetical protein